MRMHLRNVLGMGLAVAALLFCSVAGAEPRASIDVPDSVGVGQPFLVRLALPPDADDVEVVWGGTSVRPGIGHADNGAEALVLLGTRLDAKPETRILLVKMDAAGERSFLSRAIEVVPHEYDKETLAVAPGKVRPPEGAEERIRREREAALNAIHTVSPVRRWSVPFALPVQGKKLSRFGLYRVFNGALKSRHKGLDFRAYLGTPIKAIAPGRVVLVGRNFFYAGNCVYIDHGNGVVSAYAHMSKVLVGEGDEVRSGQTVGLSGATGRVTGAHLHLSVYAQGVNVDPESLFSMGAK